MQAGDTGAGFALGVLTRFPAVTRSALISHGGYFHGPDRNRCA